MAPNETVATPKACGFDESAAACGDRLKCHSHAQNDTVWGERRIEAQMNEAAEALGHREFVLTRLYESA